MTRTALLITFHNWSGKRLGGFHKFAEALCADGFEVGFLSFPRPWYGALKNTERESAGRLFRQVRGETYGVARGSLVNFTVPTFSLPGKLRRFVPDRVVARLEQASIPSITGVCRRKFPCVDFIMFESTSGILLYDAFRRAYPHAAIIYRPSDPVVADPACQRHLRVAERRILERADLVLLVDDSSRSVYYSAFPDLDLGGERFHEVRNGVDLQAFRSRGHTPAGFENRPVALYLGAHPPNWSALTYAAAALPEVTFLVVCPERPQRDELARFLDMPNAQFVPGVAPETVPEYVTSSDVVVVPYDKQRKPALATLGVTAKMLQAMAARKPIVALDVNETLLDYGIRVCGTKEEFAKGIEAALRASPSTYSLDLHQYEWSHLQERFLTLVRSCVGESIGAHAPKAVRD